MTPSSPPGLPRRTVLCGMAAVTVALGLCSCAATRTDVLDAVLAQLVGGLDPNGATDTPPVTNADRRSPAPTGS